MARARRPWLALAVLCLGTFAVLIDTTIVNVALPSLVTSLHASLDQALWVVNAYLLVFASTLIFASRLGDMLGPRRLFTIGLALFAVASALCGAAQSPSELIAARALQGVGAAALTPQAMVIIQAVFPRERMGTAFGVFYSMAGLAAVSGPVLGGVLTTYLSWRWVFYVNLPIAAAGVALAYLYVPDIRTGQRHRLDLPGVLLASAGLAIVVYGVIEGQHYDWGTVEYGITIPEVIGAGLVVLAGFVAWERRHAQPLMPLSLFRNQTFAIMVVLNVLVQFALQSMLLVNSINWQSVLGFTAVHAGLTSLPLTLVLTAMAPFAGRLTDRLGGKYVLMGGLVLFALGIVGVVAVSSVHATSLTFAPVLVVAGLGLGAIFAPLATDAMRAAPPQLAGAASGVLNTGRQLGATLGGAISGAVLATQLAASMHARALTDSQLIPATARPGFVAGFSRAASQGLQVGRGQAAASLPRGTPAPLIPLLRRLTSDVFAHGYIIAARPTLAISVAILLVGTAACLLLRRRPAPVPDIAAAPSADQAVAAAETTSAAAPVNP
jgi:EmrB/QacA subfamily drug resistance transporter